MSQPSSTPTEKEQLQARYNELDRQQPTTYLTTGLNTVPIQEEGVTGPGPVAVKQQHYDEARSPTPPPYSGPSSSSQADGAAGAAGAAGQPPKGPQRYPGLPPLDYRLYSPPLFTLSSDATAIRSTAPYLSAHAGALMSLVRAQAAVPPKPQVHITGSRGRRVDFAVKLNLLPLLVPDDPRQRLDYVRCVAAGELALRGGTRPATEPEPGDGGLEAWCRRFVDDTASVKSFALERVVVNMDTAWLEGQIRSLVATTGYKGALAVSFPTTHARVVVQSPDKVNKFFTGIATLFAGKHQYEVVRAVWPFATHPSGEPGRRWAVQSEGAWWREWRDPIRYAIATKRQGWVTLEDKFECVMENKGKAVAVVDWGPDE